MTPLVTSLKIIVGSKRWRSCVCSFEMHGTGLQLIYSDPRAISNRRRVAGVAEKLTFPKLKDICKECSLRRLGDKAMWIGRIASHWASLLSDEEDKESSAK